MKRTILLILITTGLVLSGTLTLAVPRLAFAQDPTPIVISLTPTVTPTPTYDPYGTATPIPTATPGGGGVAPDRFEPNDNMGQATVVALGVEPDLTLTSEDEDFFTGYAKAGQIIRVSTYVDTQLDTRLTIYWNGQIVGQNDDRSPSDLGSTVIFSAAADGWYIAHVERAGIFEGYYDLETALAEPTITPTPPPSLTPTPTTTPVPTATPLVPNDFAEPNNTPEQAYAITPGVQNTNLAVGANDPADYYKFLAKLGTNYTCETVTNQVDTLIEVYGVSGLIAANDDRSTGRVDSYVTWYSSAEQPVVIKVTARNGFGPYSLTCATFTPQPVMPPPPTPGIGGGDAITDTADLSPTLIIPLTMRPLGQVIPEQVSATTSVRLLIYYDANNDKQPSPGEGVPNVSVVAVNKRGGQLARVFTNAQGEAVFNLVSADVERIIVPFVPSWFSTVRIGEENDITLGLPAVRIPVFIPVRTPAETR